MPRTSIRRLYEAPRNGMGELGCPSNSVHDGTTAQNDYFGETLMRMSAIRATALGLALLPGTALALPRAWVSAEIGVDTGTCTRSVPCRTFTYAITQVDPGGEVNALDSGGYGTMLIGQSVTINVAPGVTAGIVTASGSPAVTIAAGASDNVVLRGLVITSNAGDGIAINGAGSVHIENTELNAGGFYTGISINNNAAARIAITDVVLRNYSVGVGANGTGLLELVLERVQVLGSNSFGIALAGSNARSVIRNGVISGSQVGVFVVCPTSSTLDIATLENNVISHHLKGVAIRADNVCKSEIVLSGNVITQHGGALR